MGKLDVVVKLIEEEEEVPFLYPFSALHSPFPLYFFSLILSFESFDLILCS